MDKLKKSFKNVTKSITSLKIIMWLRLLLGIYFKISDSKLISWLLRLYCLCICAACTITYRAHFKVSFKRPNVFNTLEFILNVIVSLVAADRYFLKFCNAATTADTIMNYKRVSHVSNYVIIIIASVVSSRIGIAIVHYLLAPMHTFPLEILIILVSINIYHVTVLIVFSLLHSRMRMLRVFLQRNYIPVNIIARNEVAITIRNLRKGLFNYSYLLDNLHIINTQMQYMMITDIAFKFPSIIYFGYLALRAYSQHIGFEFITNTWEAVEAIFLVTSPGIIAELIISEVDNIKETLITQLLKCSDESLRYELETALQYVRWRPFQCKLCGAVPLDARLPLNMAALCLTYVIVSVQFLHLR